MSKLLSIFLAASLLLYPFATYAADYGSQPVQNQQVPPVAQTLVREGDFAIKLASELGLGSFDEEAVAIDALTRAGVVPSNGWIPDYPVTPEIIGQLSDSIVHASQQGKLAVSSDSAEKSLADVAVAMNLPLPGGFGSAGYQAGAATDYNRTVVNNYYYTEGPPVITYYPPPSDYLYLYDWVPYPVVWFGFSFPGFFICHNFSTVVPVHAFPHHHHFGTPIVTNHIFDPVTRTSAHMHHVFRSHEGTIRPETVLLTPGGRSFRNVTEFRQGAAAGKRDIRPGSSSPAGPSFNRSPGATRWPQSAFNAPSGTRSPSTALNRPSMNNPSMRKPIDPAPKSAQSSRSPLQMQRPPVMPRSQQRMAPPTIAKPQISPRMLQRSMPAPSSVAPALNGPRFAAPGAPSRPAPSFPGGFSQGRAAGGFHGHSGARR